MAFRLVFARAALDHAQRQLDGLRSVPPIGPSFHDRVRYVLDALLEVTRQVDRAVKSPRTDRRPGFDAWVPALPNPVREYRNDTLTGRADVPGPVSRTGVQTTLKFENGASTSSFDAQYEDGSEIAHADGIVSAPDRTDVVWYFREGPWDGEPVVEALEKRLRQLRDEIIPTAERLLTSLSCVGRDGKAASRKD